MPSAYVLINCELGYEDQIVNELDKLNGVDDANGLDGAYDIIAKVNAESIENLKEIIMLHVRKIDKIQSMTTLIVIEDKHKL
jgi:DNA-binding Lrp family transcriptional regulator